MIILLLVLGVLTSTQCPAQSFDLTMPNLECPQFPPSYYQSSDIEGEFANLEEFLLWLRERVETTSIIWTVSAVDNYRYMSFKLKAINIADAVCQVAKAHKLNWRFVQFDNRLFIAVNADYHAKTR